MSAAADILRRLSEIGASIRPAGNDLILRAGKKPIPGDLVRRLQAEKAEVLAALAPAPQTADAAWLHRRFAVQTIHWKLGGYRSHLDAQCIAFSELLDEFREKHGRRWPRWQCAGCDEPIGDLPALTLADENRIHFDECRECLIRFGRRWRSDAVAGLRALGLKPPPGFELL